MSGRNQITGQRTPVILSGEDLIAAPTGLLMPADRFQPEQDLFGDASRVRMILRRLADNGAPCLLTPSPELFTEALLKRRLADGGKDGQPWHLRVSGRVGARLLKGARNVLVTADHPARPSFVTSRHPFVHEDAAPAGFAAAVGLGGEVHFSGPRGGAIAALDFEALMADLGAPPTIDARPGEGRVLLAPVEAVAQSGLTGRAMRPLTGRVFGLPLNLADPASAVTELARRLSDSDSGASVVVFPFNCGDLQGAAGRLLALTEGEPDRRVQMAWITGDPVQALARARMTWVLDGECPEVMWSLSQVCATGAPVLVIGGAPDLGDRLAPADRAREIFWWSYHDSERVEVDDHAGLRWLTAGRPTDRDTQALLDAAA